MKFFAHRINTIEELQNIQNEYGVELDLRAYNEHIIVQHDPFLKGQLFTDYIKQVNNRDMILNIKCEGIESIILDILQQTQYDGNYIFLDCSFPIIHSLVKQNEPNIAIRFSEYEGFDLLNNMQGKVKWVWIDVFNEFPLNAEIFRAIKQLGYQICLVSPELQNHENDIELYAALMQRDNILVDAICCKHHNISRWKKLFSI